MSAKHTCAWVGACILFLFTPTNTWAQVNPGAGLPDYGILRLQNGAQLTYGSYPVQLYVTDTSVFLQGTGWDSLSAARGFYIDEVTQSGAAPVMFDTANVYNVNEGWPRTIVPTRDGFLVSRYKSFESGDPLQRFGALAEYLEYVGREADSLAVASITIDSSVVQLPQSIGHYSSQLPLTNLLVSIDDVDTLRYGWISLHRDLGIVSLDVQTYGFTPSTTRVPAPVGQRMPIDMNFDFEVDEYVFGGWTLGDTLGLAWRHYEANTTFLSVRQFSLRTGERLVDPSLPVRIGTAGVFVADQVKKRGFVAALKIDYPQPRQPRITPELTGLDLRSGQSLWRREFPLQEGWSTGTFIACRPGATGRQVLLAYESSKPFGRGPYEVDYRIEVRGLDADTGDSLWATTLVLDSFANRAHGLVPMDLAVRPDGKGFVLAGWVAERTIDQERDLRYSHTALFFLDSVGCLTPNCREPNAIGEKGHAYEIQLAPNPVQSGAPIRVRLPETASGRFRWAITDGLGRRVGFGESRVASNDNIEVQPPPLPAGAYYLTVTPVEHIGVVVTKGFVVGG